MPSRRRPAFRRSFVSVETLESRVNPVSFANPVGYGTPGNTISVASGDFNADGFPDVVAGNSGGVTTFLNNGTGILVSGTTLSLSSGSARTIRVADMTGDGVPDIVTGNDFGHSIGILVGNGDGTFQSQIVVNAGKTDVQSIQIADLNSDGKADVAVAVDGGLAVMLNDGSAKIIGSPTLYTSPTNGGAMGVTVADYNGDGKLDAAVTAIAGHRVDVFLNVGSGKFGPAIPTDTGAGTQPFGIVGTDFVGNALDLNADGKADLSISLADTPFVAVLLGKGDGSFQAPVSYTTSFARTGRLVAADFDMDGKVDIGVQVQAGGTTTDQVVLLGNGAGGLAAPFVTPASGGPTDITAADMNGDGLPDLLSSSSFSPGSVDVSLNTTVVATPHIASFVVTTVASSKAGQGFDVTVKARSSPTTTFTTYTGTVSFTSTDPQVLGGNGLPAEYTFTLGDAGQHTFSNVILKTAGVRPLTVRDKSFPAAGGTALVTVVPDLPAIMTLTGFPASVVAGASNALTVTIRDAYQNPITGYTGTVHFTSMDPLVSAGNGLPTDYTFLAGENGLHTFSAVSLRTAGTISVSVADTPGGTVAGTLAGITVTPGAASTITTASGGGQSVAVTTSFGPTVALVTDVFGNPVSGVTVSFSAPAGGASVTFPSGSSQKTDAVGKASVTAEANTVAGSYALSAAVAGIAQSAAFSLTNLSGPASSVAVLSGKDQSAEVGKSYSAQLVVGVTDQFGNPVSGVSVGFAGPATGAGVTFPGGATFTTDSSGKVAVGATANSVAGSLVASATATGVTTPASFALTNLPGAVVNLVVVSGSDQSTTVNVTFPTPLTVLASDVFGNPVPGVAVTFSGPATGAGVTFPGGTAAITNSVGRASVTAKANTKAGGYAVDASAAGIATPASFVLTNAAGIPTTIAIVSGSNQTVGLGQPFVTPVVQVTDEFANPVSGVEVTMAGPTTGAGVTFPSGTTTATDGAGQAGVQLTANGIGGTYFVTASVPGVATPATLTLTNQSPAPSLVGFHEFGGGGTTGTVRFFNPNGSERYQLTPFPGFTGEIRTVAGDFNADGIADLVVGTGPGIATQVRILDGVTKAQLFSINPFEAAFTGGVFVAAGDLTGDGKAELVVTPDEGGGPRARVFNGAGFKQIADFFGIDDPNFRGGARAAVGDLNGDGKGDLLVAAGFGGGPRLAAYNGALLGPTGGPKLFADFFVFEQTLRNGVFVAAGDLNGDGFADLIAGGGPGGGPRVFALSGKNLVQSGQQTQVANFFAGDPNSRGGIRVSIKNLDGDARADMVVGAGTGAGSRVTGYRGATIQPNGTPPIQFGFDVFPGNLGGVYVG